LLDPFGNILSPEYLSAMRLRLIDGRWLSDADTLTTRPVIVVDRSFAKRYLSDRPIGMHVPIPFGEGRPDADVIELVDDMRQADVTDAPAAEVFISYRQVPNRIPNGGMALVIRTVDDPMAHVAALRTVVREQDAAIALDSIMTMEERVAMSLAKPRLYALLLGGFAMAALTIAGVGLFGVLSYSVADPRHRHTGAQARTDYRVWRRRCRPVVSVRGLRARGRQRQ
jgi:putative ABC transport system permease protein